MTGFAACLVCFCDAATMPRKLRLEYPGAMYHVNEVALEEFRQAWSIGGEAFRRECLEQMEGKLGENHPGQAKLETAEAKADRIVAEGLARLRWTQDDLVTRQKSHPEKLALAARLRQETTLSVKQIAESLHLGKPKGARTNLHKFMNRSQAGGPQIQLGIQ